MKIASAWMVILAASTLSAFATPAFNVDLGSAESFGLLGGAGVTNSGASSVVGSVGVWTGTSITGFAPGSITGSIHAGDAVAMQAQGDLNTAYNFAAGQACSGDNVLTGQDLGGLTLTAGVYCFASSAQLTGTLMLDAQEDPNAFFLFQIGSTLTTASNSLVAFIENNRSANVFWQIGSSATLGTGTGFSGNLLALASITLNTGASIQCGRALAMNGAVTLGTNSVDTGSCQSASTVPEPATSSLVAAAGLFLGLAHYARHRRANARSYSRISK